MRGFLFTLLVVTSEICLAGHFVGNGGDHIRASYIKVGEAVVDYLKETEEGSLIARKNQLDLLLIADTLDIEKISVSQDTLRDNSGSIVEAIGIENKVTLNQEAWANHFEKERDIYYLVFHEMLRSAAINDDDYVISKALNPFPVSRKVATKITPLIPLISDDLLVNAFDVKNVRLGGTGCNQSLDSHRIEFDLEKNILDVRLLKYRNEVSKLASQSIRACQIAIPVTPPKNKRLIISQIDLAGKIDLLPGAKSRISFEAFLAGTVTPSKTRVFEPANALYGRFQIRRTEVLKSKCGVSDIVRLNTGMTTIGSGQKLEVLEMQSMSLYFNLEDCK